MFEMLLVSFGGGGAPDVPAIKPTPRSPTRVEPEIALAKQNLRERMLRAQGRAASREAGPGFLETTKTKGLTDKLA